MLASACLGPSLPCLPPSCRFVASPPGEEDVCFIFEVEAKEGRVVICGAVLLVTVTMGGGLGVREDTGTGIRETEGRTHWLFRLLLGYDQAIRES